MDKLLVQPDFVASLAIGGFVLLLFLIVLMFTRGKGKTRHVEDKRDHRLRELEVENRLLQEKLDKAAAVIEQKAAELDVGMQTLHDLNKELEDQSVKVKTLNNDRRAAVKKTNQLRRELADRAAEGLRESARAKEAETELDVARVGAEVIADEYSRLTEARKGKRTRRTDFNPMNDTQGEESAEMLAASAVFDEEDN